MSSSPNLVRGSRRPFNLAPDHRISVLLAASPILADIPEVRTFFALLETWFAAPARKAIEERLFVYSNVSWGRGLMILSGLSAGWNGQQKVEIMDAFHDARRAIFAIPATPGGKSEDAHFEVFCVVAGILLNGIHRATKCAEAFTGTDTSNAEAAPIYEFATGERRQSA